MGTTILKRHFNLSLISEYRTELMGYGILFVMLSHALASWMQIPVAGSIVGKMTTLVHTQGFFFLSGFGLYYSFAKNKDISQFYYRRLLRMYIPFLLMSFPIYMTIFILKGSPFIDYVLVQSALGYYILGKGAMWYISATLFLYAVFPLIFHLLFNKNNSTVNLIICLALWLCIALLLYCFHIEYYHQIDRLIAKFPMFIVGIYVGCMAKQGGDISIKVMIGLFLLMCALILANQYNIDFVMYYKDVAALLGMMCIAAILKKTNGGGAIGITLKWLGKYSLELYIYHMLLKGLLENIVIVLGYDMNLTIQRIIVPIAVIVSIVICQPVHRGIDRLLNK